jgi:hypothetical protein
MNPHQPITVRLDPCCRVIEFTLEKFLLTGVHAVFVELNGDKRP